ncbi:hypothetical protein AC1031_017704 [Aphanomyces cochlioides]|nr:hypothetical protein AC1031_017704 [Aphanomyces cochlioides]
MKPMQKRQSNRTVMAVFRVLHAAIGVAIVATMMESYPTFRLDDGDVYRYAQTYHFCVVVVGYTALQYGAWYFVFVSYMKRMRIDIILERLLDIILLLTHVLCGYFASVKASCPPEATKATNLRCSGLQATMALCFSNAGIFLLVLIYGFVVRLPSHPDSMENLVPRGNYGGNYRSSDQTPVDAHVPPVDSDQPGRKSMPMLSPLWDVLSTADKAPTHEDDKTGNLVARGQFGNVKIEDVDKTDRLLPRGNFGSLAQKSALDKC